MNNYLDSKDEMKVRAFYVEVYRKIKKNAATVKANYPQLYDWISYRLKINQQYCKQKRVEQLKEGVKEIFSTYNKIGIIPTFEDIYTYLGYKRNALRQYPEIMQLISSALHNLDVKECLVCNEDTMLVSTEHDFDIDEENVPVAAWWNTTTAECLNCRSRIYPDVGEPKDYGIGSQVLWESGIQDLWVD